MFLGTIGTIFTGWADSPSLLITSPGSVRWSHYARVSSNCPETTGFGMASQGRRAVVSLERRLAFLIQSYSFDSKQLKDSLGQVQEMEDVLTQVFLCSQSLAKDPHPSALSKTGALSTVWSIFIPRAFEQVPELYSYCQTAPGIWATSVSTMQLFT